MNDVTIEDVERRIKVLDAPGLGFADQQMLLVCRGILNLLKLQRDQLVALRAERAALNGGSDGA